MNDTRERLTTPLLSRFIVGGHMQHNENRRAILVEGLGETFYVDLSMRTATIDDVPVLILRLHEPPETPVPPPMDPAYCRECGCRVPCNCAGTQPSEFYSHSDWIDDRCLVCGHAREDHHAGTGRCFGCPHSRRCRAFAVKPPREL